MKQAPEKRETIVQNILIREKSGFTEPVTVLIGIRKTEMRNSFSRIYRSRLVTYAEREAGLILERLMSFLPNDSSQKYA
jgi:hypothetical protein